MTDQPPPVLLDASVLVELVIDGRHRDGADRVLDHLAAEPAVDLVTAAHGLVEAASALRRLARSGALHDDAAEVLLGALAKFDLRLDPTAPRVKRIWNLRHSMTAYDAAYAAAAEAWRRPLITSDERLLRACDAASIHAVHLRDVRFD